MIRKYILILINAVLIVPLAFSNNQDIKKVYIVFKTHLDIGFTELGSVVEKRYVDEFIPNALDLAEKFKKDGSGDKFVWNTGAWLIWQYLQTAPPKEVVRLEKAILQGDICWNAAPYTIETESMNSDLLETTLMLSKKLDEKYGKKTISAKMTDVPGHTRSIISSLHKSGIKFLHIGMNSGPVIPKIPQYCRWRNPKGEEVVLVYDGNYGGESVIPGTNTVISIILTGDNRGPQGYNSVKKTFENLRQRYPNAEVVSTSLDKIAEEVLKIKDSLPVVTSEIGDTWIYGYASSPIRMAKYRALSSLYTKWLDEKKLIRDSDESLKFAVRLGMVAEHTQGLRVQTFLTNYDKYDIDSFLAARSKGVFDKCEKAWSEVDQYVYEALSFLPLPLQQEAMVKLKEIENPPLYSFNKKSENISPQKWTQAILDGNLRVEGLTYQMYDSLDFVSFINKYMRKDASWVWGAYSKPGISKTKAVSITLPAYAIRKEIRKERKGTRSVYELAFLNNDQVDSRVYPQKILVNTLEYKKAKKAEIELTIFNKPAVRLPESYWLSFNTSDIVSLVAEKTGERVDLLDVVENGNRQMHGIDRYVDIITTKGTVRIWSEAAFLINVGEARGLGFSNKVPDKDGGIHFNLSNNLWGTNFRMWNEGSLCYRFIVELL